MKGRPLPGQVERPFGAPERLTSDEFAELVLGTSSTAAALSEDSPRQEEDD